MKKVKNLVSLVLVVMLVLATPINSLAKPRSGGSSNSKAKSTSVKTKTVKTQSNKVEKNVKLVNEHKESNNVKKELRKSIKELKQAAQKSYSQEELTNLQNSVDEIKANYPGIKTIPVENIISRRMNMKFDTPPVIKEGRTLIPVRALTQAFGAQVSWNPEEKQVTIVKDDMEMVLQIDSNTTYVNGEEVEIDVPAEIMNSRTVVPLRFIVEKMGLTVEWDDETETIEIVDEEDQTTDEQVVIEEDNTTSEEEQIIEEPVQEEGQAVEEPVQEEQQPEETQTDILVDGSSNDTVQETNDQTVEQTTDTDSNAI